MTGLALMHIHYGMELNLDEIINKFAGRLFTGFHTEGGGTGIPPPKNLRKNYY